jgi:hypothetical protein
MMKIENAYDCDCCHQLFRHGDGYREKPKGMEIQLSIGEYGRINSPQWSLAQVCDSCREKLDVAIRAVAGEPSDTPRAMPEVPKPPEPIRASIGTNDDEQPF